MPNNNDNFQSSSFIPKDDNTPSYRDRITSKKSMGALLKFSVGILVLALLLVAAAFFYTQYLQSNLADKKDELAQAQAAFDTSVIEELEVFDERLSSVQKIVDEHTVVTPVFDLIEENTLAAVQLNSVSISSQSAASGASSETGAGENPEQPPADGPATEDAPPAAAEEGGESSQGQQNQGLVPITMTGVTGSYASVVLQAQALEDSSIIQNSQLSNFELNEQGQVTFSVSFSIPSSYVQYDRLNRSAGPGGNSNQPQS